VRDNTHCGDKEHDRAHAHTQPGLFHFSLLGLSVDWSGSTPRLHGRQATLLRSARESPQDGVSTRGHAQDRLTGFRRLERNQLQIAQRTQFDAIRLDVLRGGLEQQQRGKFVVA
jgi:hypothetical protein